MNILRDCGQVKYIGDLDEFFDRFRVKNVNAIAPRARFFFCIYIKYELTARTVYVTYNALHENPVKVTDDYFIFVENKSIPIRIADI